MGHKVSKWNQLGKKENPEEWESELGPFHANDTKAFPRWSKARAKSVVFTTPPKILTKSKGSASIKHKELGKIPKQRVRTNRKETEMKNAKELLELVVYFVVVLLSVYFATDYFGYSLPTLAGGIAGGVVLHWMHSKLNK